MIDLMIQELGDFLEGELGGDAAAAFAEEARREPRADLRGLLGRLPRPAGLTDEELLRRFGRRLFPRFAALYPAVFAGVRSWRELLLGTLPSVHEELQKLVPEAEFPTLTCRRLSPESVEIDYRSPRDLGPLAEGMLLGCLDYFGASGAVSREDVALGGERGCKLVVTAM